MIEIFKQAPQKSKQFTKLSLGSQETPKPFLHNNVQQKNCCNFFRACLRISVIVVVDDDSQFFESLPKCYFRRCYFWTPQKHRSTKFLSSNQLVTNNTGLRGDSLTLPRSNSLWHFSSNIV